MWPRAAEVDRNAFRGPSMSQFIRRDFLKTSLAAGLFAAMGGNSRALRAANEEINLAIVGLGGRGGEHANMFRSVPGVKIVGLVDPDESRQMAFQAKFPGSRVYSDLRNMLDDSSIDVVSIATCNHWHCLAAIWAMQAGKDVYVEKPLSHSQWEGRQVVAAARKYNRIVQHGTQQRSSLFQAEIRKFLHEEQGLGEIQFVQVCRYGIRQTIGKRETPLPIPAGVDYNLWLGPAEDRPLFREKFHYDWHWDWNTGSGEMGNWGVHVLDDVRNTVFRDEITLPTRILAGGGRLAWNDAGETPNVHFAYFDTGKIPTFIGLSNLPAQPNSKSSLNYRGVSTGYLVQCEGGHYAGRRGGGEAYDTAGKVIRSFKGDAGSSHGANFIQAVRARDNALLKSPIDVGHDSTGWCNLANIGFRAGGAYSVDQSRELNGHEAAWQVLLDQMKTHIEAHGYQMNDAAVRLSPLLQHDPATERFVGPHAELANPFLKRTYREPFVVPEIA